MRVRVDQSRDQDVLGQIYALVVMERRRNFAGRENRFDRTVAHRDGVMLENRARRFDRDDPAGAEEEAYLGVPWTSTTTRLLSARHAISALRSFWSGQAFTGSVLPKPSVSTLPASTPFDTR